MKGFKTYIIIGSALLLIYLVAQFHKPVPTDWTPSYLVKDKIPYGAYILHNNLADMLPGVKIQHSREPVYNALESANYRNAAYLIVSPSIDLDTNDYGRLIKFAEEGNSVFFATGDAGRFIRRKLKISVNYLAPMSGQKSKGGINFTNPYLKTGRNYTFNKSIGNQFYTSFDTARAEVLGITHEGKANFLKFPLKKGALFLISDPAFFSNYNMLEPRGAEYAAKALSYLNGAETLLFDQFYTAGREGDPSLFRFFFNNPQLKYGYWLAITAFLLFLAFEIKRRQRVIPIADAFANSSVEFVNVVSGVYYKQRNNRDIAEKQITYFFDHLRTRYFWKINNPEKDFEILLEQKTGISAALAKGLTLQIRYIQKETFVHDNILINLNNLIESFFKQSK